ncbi:MAG: hypothetical protein JWN30_1375, partial [Bacilli bacterium]|nr:hypothetical protein [Bacilli bacterium]
TMSGIGLKNVNERLKIIYGDSFSMDVQSTPGVGTKITLHFPNSPREVTINDVQSDAN